MFKIVLAALFLLASGFGSTGLAQEQQEERPAPEVGRPAPEGMPMGRDSNEMQDMARAMESMADMCRMMMQREMQNRPYFLAAGAVVAVLFAIALVLLIALEIQAIRFLGVRIKTERQKLS